jgi:CheY-like chemotaxis protein
MEPSAKRILIVDDDPVIRTVLMDYLASVGYAAVEAADVPDALEKLAVPLAAVISDIQMPGASGIEFLQAARRLNPTLAVLLITGSPTLETVVDAKLHGAVAYLRKPARLDPQDGDLRIFLEGVAARLRGLLHDESERELDGKVLLVGPTLLERFADRLTAFQTISCAPEEAAFLQIVRHQRPMAVLAAAGPPETALLLHTYMQLGREANSFLLVVEEPQLDAASDLLFNEGAAGCISVGATRSAVEQCIRDAVHRRAAQRLAQQQQDLQLTNKCPSAKPYRNGYACQQEDACPYGPFQAGWIAVDHRQVQKCARRPLLVTSLDDAGFVTIAGTIDHAQAMEVRKTLMGIVREGRREVVVDAQGLVAVTEPLVQVLSEISTELAQCHANGWLHVINLSAPLQEEFRHLPIGSSRGRIVRFSGNRMVDVRSAFERWGTRFD